jgi:hypothetical protein
MLQPLFIVGNKRSGTSQLVRVLNLHPGVFVSHESDIAWILQQFHRGQSFQAHPWDSDRGMRQTLETAGHLLHRDSTPWENFLNVQMAVMEKGTPWLPAQQKPGLKWLGDKKPMQHTDPELLKFLRLNFPWARFLHIVRHPFEVVESSDRFNRTKDGDFWQGLSPADKLERWTFHEQQVLELQQNWPGCVHSLRFEDFCRDTGQVLAGVFNFLELEPDRQIMREAARQTRPLFRAIPSMQGSAETMRIAAKYGYDLAHPAGPVRRRIQSLYWRMKKTWL